MKGLKKQMQNIHSYPSPYAGREDLFSNIGTKEMLRFKLPFTTFESTLPFLFSCMCPFSPPHEVKYRRLFRITCFFKKRLKDKHLATDVIWCSLGLLE